MGLINKLRQGALSLVGGKPAAYEKGLQAAEQVMVKGPGGEYYTFPKEIAQQYPLDSPAIWSYIRRLIDEGQVNPVLDMRTGEIPYQQVAKAQKAMDLAQRVKEAGLPRKGSFRDPEFDALALKLNAPGTKADAVAALSGPQTTGEKSMFLHDLAASDVPGAGGHLLRSLLKGPLFDDAGEVVFTPINTDDTMNFYRKFGMRYLSPSEAATDPRISELMKRLDETRNAKDLGVGVIQRAEGGLVKTDRSGSLPDHGVQQKEFEKSKKAMRGGLEALGNFAYDAVIPQDAVDVGLMMVVGPGGKLVKKAGAALAASGSSDADAGTLARVLSKLPGKMNSNFRALAKTYFDKYPETGAVYSDDAIVRALQGKNKFVTPEYWGPEYANKASGMPFERPVSAKLRGSSPSDYHRATFGESDELRYYLEEEPERLQSVIRAAKKGEIDELPMMLVDESGSVVNYDGVHRAEALRRLFGDKVAPVSVFGATNRQPRRVFNDVSEESVLLKKQGGKVDLPPTDRPPVTGGVRGRSDHLAAPDLSHWDMFAAVE